MALLIRSMRIVDEQAVVRSRRPGGPAPQLVTPASFHRGAVGDHGMAVDPLQHDRPVGHDGIEIGGGGEALVRPQFLVPADDR